MAEHAVETFFFIVFRTLVILVFASAIFVRTVLATCVKALLNVFLIVFAAAVTFVVVLPACQVVSELIYLDGIFLHHDALVKSCYFPFHIKR